MDNHVRLCNHMPMTRSGHYYEIQYSTKIEPDLWRAIGDTYRSFVEAASKAREFYDEAKNNIKMESRIDSFRIVEREVFLKTEEIKTYKL